MTITFKSASLLIIATACAVSLSACTTETKIKSAANSQAVQITTLAADKSHAVQQAIKDDFGYPAEKPLLSRGKAVFKNNCAACHNSGNLNYGKISGDRPVEQYLVLTRGKGHKAFRNLTRQQRWEAVFYYRFLSGGPAYTYKKEGLQGIYGSNCAVCHGKGGQADGPLHTGHASRHELGMAPVKVDFVPPPANFADYPRFYNRTDDTLVKHIAEGVYPSGMPPWFGRIDKAKQFVFDEKMIRELVFYVREFSYENDLPEAEQIKGAGPIAGQWSNPTADEIRHAELKSASQLKIGGGGVR